MKKRLGQHFLTSGKKLRKIVESLDLKSGDIIIEIGPGHGELTKELRIEDLGFRIIAIEKDERLAENLRSKIHDLRLKNIKIITGDALKIIPKLTQFSILNSKSYKLVGNIPYYITGQLLRILGEIENKPSLIVLMIQKEVAERICAEPPKMNLLAASVQFWAKPEIISYVSKKYFRPAPKVDSAIIKLTANSLQPTAKEAENYYKFIKILFKQPRKTILNNLIEANKREYLREKTQKEEVVKKIQKLKINPTRRPQNLSLEQIKKYAEEV
ncbi:ribosomal RNA small subunit methyltransferase A [Candidatus Wolfebacteria bacterium]|nr:ribosomal RNA small subunit methyltransferase A [Candidatus Wolfebacteria bacterium]